MHGQTDSEIDRWTVRWTDRQIDSSDHLHMNAYLFSDRVQSMAGFLVFGMEYKGKRSP